MIGNAANYVEIKTFHSYCFDLLRRIGNLGKSDDVLRTVVEKIRSGEVEISRITKTVLVIDEAQDMAEDEFALVNALMQRNEEMRVIAVGDDDHNIFEFRGADSVYLERFLSMKEAMKYELIDNYRSKNNLVEFANQFATCIGGRLKSLPIVAKQTDNGDIRLTRYRSGRLIVPIVNDVLSASLAGSTCVLTTTNEEAEQTAGLLLKHGMPSKLIQTNDGFSLMDLDEIRFLWNNCIWLMMCMS